MDEGTHTVAPAGEPVTAIVMAGGGSRRMKTDKSLLLVNGQTMVEHVIDQLRPHFSEILISAQDEEKYAFTNVTVVKDFVPGRGPLIGMISSLKAASNDLCFIQACDIPETNMVLVKKMLGCSKGYDGVAPRTDEGRLEPLFAVYRKSAIGAMEELLAMGKMRATSVLTACNIKFVDLRKGEEIQNLNTAEQYRNYIKSR